MLRTWLDWCFPPLCIACEQPCETKLFCPSCWELSLPIDPKERCLHCFQELDVPMVCRVCRKSPFLPIPSAFVFEPTHEAKLFCRKIDDAPEALAGFFVLQWGELNWPIPDAILPLDSLFPIAEIIASWLGCSALRHWRRSFSAIEVLGEEKTFLILGKELNAQTMRGHLAFLSGAFPKKIYSLNLLYHDDRVHSFNPPSPHRGGALSRDAHCSAAASMDCSEAWEI